MPMPGLAPAPVEVHRVDPVPDAEPVRRRPVLAPRPPRAARVDARALLLSGLAHLAVLGGLVLVLGTGRPPPEPATAPSEAVDYIDLEWPAGDAGGASGSEAAPTAAADPSTDPALPRRQPDATPLTFPGRVPQGLPGATASGGVGTPQSGGAAGGGGGVGERLQPGFRDTRLYVSPDELPRPEKSNRQKYMDHLTARIEASNDSAYAASSRPNTDWTFKDGKGGKWGLSEDGLHLGGFTVPKELVPRPRPTGTNQDLERARDEQRQRDEIRRQEADRERREARERSTAETRARKDAEREKTGGDPG